MIMQNFALNAHQISLQLMSSRRLIMIIRSMGVCGSNVKAQKNKKFTFAVGKLIHDTINSSLQRGIIDGTKIKIFEEILTHKIVLVLNCYRYFFIQFFSLVTARKYLEI